MSTEVSGRIQELCRLYGLTERDGQKLEAMVAMLTGDVYAPTSIRDAELVADLHLADSLEALNLDVVRRGGVVADIGAGAGFPGLPLAVALPHAELRLVESQTRKCAFIERVVAVAGIENARIVCTRVEEWSEGVEAQDVVLARAVAPQPVVLEYAAPLLRVGGALVDWRGQRNPAEEHAAVAAAELLGLECESIRRVEPYAGVRDHHLHVYMKICETPERFPRRVGVARKKPLAS